VKLFLRQPISIDLTPHEVTPATYRRTPAPNNTQRDLIRQSGQRSDTALYLRLFAATSSYEACGPSVCHLHRTGHHRTSAAGVVSRRAFSAKPMTVKRAALAGIGQAVGDRRLVGIRPPPLFGVRTTVPLPSTWIGHSVTDSRSCVDDRECIAPGAIHTRLQPHDTASRCLVTDQVRGQRHCRPTPKSRRGRIPTSRHLPTA